MSIEAVTADDPFEALLVAAGPDGPELHTGHTVEVHPGGCALDLQHPLRAPFTGGVVVLRRRDGEQVALLAAPRRRADPGTKVVDLHFLPAVDPDTHWADFLTGGAS